jgi:type II secretory pathway component HofQ
MRAGSTLTGVALLLIVVSAFSFADGLNAPRVTLSVTDEPRARVLERIAEQTGVSIVMTNEVAGRESISMRVRNAELETALDYALSSYNYTLVFSADQKVISKVVITVQEKKEGVAMQADSPAVTMDGNRLGGDVEKAISQMEAGLAIRSGSQRLTAQSEKNGATPVSKLVGSDPSDMKNAMEQLANKINERR